MFDLRYHVASLTAVFVALVIGILVGIGLSGKGFVNDAERANLTGQHRRPAARARRCAGLARRGEPRRAGARRLRRRRVSERRPGTARAGRRSRCCSSGRSTRACRSRSARACAMRVAPSSARDRSACRSTLRRSRTACAATLPSAATSARITSAISATHSRRSSPPAGKTPLWDALGKIIVQEREGSATPPADAVVVVRSAGPQQGLTKTLLAGLYGGLARSGVPAVGTEASSTSPSAIPAFSLAGLSTVDSVDTSAGRLGLVLLLAGARAGQLRRRGDGRRRRAAVDPSAPAAGVNDPASGPAHGPRRGA